MLRTVNIAAILIFASPLFAMAQVTWRGTQDSDWTNPANWEPATVPIAGTIATLASTGGNMINVGSAASVGQIRFRDEYTIVGDGSITMDGGNSGGSISGDREASRIDVPVDLAGPLRLSGSFNTPLTFGADINIHSHELFISGNVFLDNADILGDGIVSLDSGTLSGSGTIEPSLRAGGGTISQSSFMILGDAQINANLRIDSETEFETINGGGQGSLEIKQLTVEFDSLADVLDHEYHVFPGWDSVTVDRIVVIPSSIVDWDVARMGEGILSFLSVAETPQCDFDFDGRCNLEDLDILGVVIRNGGSDNSVDLNGDNVIDLKDRDEWLLLAGRVNGFAGAYLVGDADLNGSVNAADLMRLGQNWQASGIGHYWEGDFNFDGQVDARDLNELARNWQGTSSPSQNAVPEPAACLLICGAVAFFATLLRHRSGQAVCLLIAATSIVQRLVDTAKLPFV